MLSKLLLVILSKGNIIGLLSPMTIKIMTCYLFRTANNKGQIQPNDSRNNPQSSRYKHVVVLLMLSCDYLTV